MQADLKEVPKAVFRPEQPGAAGRLSETAMDDRVRTAPVMIVQGDADKLVDYRGTYA